MKLPVLYSFRRCPYAMRARLAIACSGVQFELREILLKDKPSAMLRVSPKGTVPVAACEPDLIIDESLELMLWVLAKHDPENWLADLDDSLALIHQNDLGFKHWLDRYKYHVGHPENSQEYYRDKAREYLDLLESKLHQSEFLLSASPRLADYAISPFVRQFAHVDLNWFENSDMTRLKNWLNTLLKTPAFERIMQKYPVWAPGEKGIAFPPSENHS